MSRSSESGSGAVADRELSPQLLQQAADRGADYLVRNLRSNGKFVYQRSAETGRPVLGSYNLLRHFGSLWAMLDVRGDDPAVCERAARGLVWALDGYYVRTRRGGAFRKKRAVATGCSGLGLLAITKLRATRGFTAADGLLVEIVDYLLAVQIRDPAQGALHDFLHQVPLDGPVIAGIHDDVTVPPALSSFRSNYYTGEILYGMLTQLAALLRSGDRSGGHFARTYAAAAHSMAALRERDYGVKERSHWMMYAIRQFCVVNTLLDVEDADEVRADMLDWAARISAAVLASTRRNRNTRSAPTACRVEAQVQFLHLVDESRRGLARRACPPELAASVEQQITDDCRLLLQLQDEATGGLVGSAEDPIMQIDYTQHSISALQGAAAVFRRRSG